MKRIIFLSADFVYYVKSNFSSSTVNAKHKSKSSIIIGGQR